MLVVATCVLAAFMLLCGAGLEQAFRSSALQVQKDRMQGVVYSLLGAAESDQDGALLIPETSVPEPRLSRMDSGLEALIFDDKGNAIWRSPNFSGTVPHFMTPGIGATLFNDDPERFTLTYGVRWAGENPTLNLFGNAPKPRNYTVAVIEDKTDYLSQIRAFRQTLFAGLGGGSAALLLVQGLVLGWGLSPLQRLAREVGRIESGDQTQIESNYPVELRPVTASLNAMIQNERNQQTRYRNALGDLAHSLKTPLAVLRGLVEMPTLATTTRQQFEEPLRRLQEITDYQLKRASAAGRRTLSEPIPPGPIIDKTIAALGKVYADKRIRFVTDIPDRLRVRADAGDLYEMLGNLLDNASKWCRKEVRIAINARERRIRFEIDDDGPGFPENAADLLKRGMRADSRTPGQGIGLATVADIVALNEGRIELLRSPKGGGRVLVDWPM
jgi:two-component system sensor histidine kinase PhoQ